MFLTYYRQMFFFLNGTSSHKKNYIDFIFIDSKSRMASISLYWFKSYGDFAEWLDLAYWWSCAADLFSLHCTHNYNVSLSVHYNMVEHSLRLCTLPTSLNSVNTPLQYTYNCTLYIPLLSERTTVQCTYH